MNKFSVKFQKVFDLSPLKAALILSFVSVAQTITLRAHSLQSPLNPPLITLYAEIVKLIVSLSQVCISKSHSHKFCLHLLVLACLYAAQNYMFITVHMFLSSNQITQVIHIRILIIAAGSRVMLRKTYSVLQYIGVLFLTCACTIQTVRVSHTKYKLRQSHDFMLAGQRYCQPKHKTGADCICK